MPEQNRVVLKTSQIEVGSDLALLPTVLEWFIQFQANTIVPQTIWLQGNMAIIEGFTNAVRHAHGSLGSSLPIALKAELSNDCFQFEIWDHGDAYDFESAIAQVQQIIKEPNFDPLVREKQWGNVIFLNLIDQHHWRIDYARQGNSRNCLRARVALPS